MSRDDAYLLDMLIAARHASDYSAGLGEAARRVSEATRSHHAQIEWSKITGMRHRLAHDYRNVDLDIVWSVVTREVPNLIAYLQKVVPPDEPDA